jgi:hypothetical protein
MGLLTFTSLQTICVTYPLKCFLSRPFYSAHLNEILYDSVSIGIVHYLGESSNVPTGFMFGTNRPTRAAQ